MGEPRKLSHDTIQHLVDQAASFNLYITPDRASAIRAPDGSGEIIGVSASESVHRFDIDLDLPTMNSGIKAANRVGPEVGRLDLRWLIAPHDFAARPDREPPATPSDVTVSQRFVLQESVFTIGNGGGFRSFGAGRTFPMTISGKPELIAAGVGVLTSGFGSLQGCEGNFTLCGHISAAEGFRGHIMVRILDPSGRLRTLSELPGMAGGPDPDPSTTFLTWVAQKGSGPDQENTASITPDGEVRGLNIPVQLKRVQVGFIPDESAGLRAIDFRTFEVIGREIGFGKESAPRTPTNGTPMVPYQFEGVSRYTFYDPDGAVVGAFTANVVEGRSMNVQLPAAPDQPALRFGYFAPIIQGFGCFEGVKGFLYGAAGSVFAPPPFDHVITNMYVARVSDPNGRFRTAAILRKPSAAVSGQPTAAPEPAQRQIFKAMVKKLDEKIPTHKRWRAGVTECSRQLSTAIAQKYNSLLDAGDFPGLRIDGESLKTIFEGTIKPFDAETFERYHGPATGVFKYYDIHNRKELGSSVLYSFWDRKTLMDGVRHYKQITGSDTGYYEPDRIPPVEENKVDLLANSYHPETGVVSFISIYQHGRQERTSFAYKMPHDHEVLWFVKDLSIDDKPLRDNVFMLSHEWKGPCNGKTCYFMVGIFFDINFATCDIRVSSDQFWRALYTEDTSQGL